MSIVREAPQGILGFPVVPMNEQGGVDLSAFEKNVDFLVQGGLSAVFVACGAGEFHALKHEEYEQLVVSALSVVAGRVPVYTGVGGNVSHAVELAQRSEQLGVDGYLILPHYLVETEQEGLFNYLDTVIASTSLNAILYQRDLCRPSVETVQRLTAREQLIGLKDGIGDMEKNIELVETVGDRLTYMSGMPLAEATFAAFAPIGFTSYSSAISNYIPHISQLYKKALQEGERVILEELYTHVIFPINRLRKMRKGYAVSLIKAGMEIMGLPVGSTVRPPLIPVEREHYDMLEHILREAESKFPRSRQAQ